MGAPYSLPTYTKTMDDDFINTWYDIKPDAIDNIITATPIWALLNEKGRLKPQVGGTIITETIDFALPVAEAIAKGHVFNTQNLATSTMASWTFRNIGINVSRDTISDIENSGKYKIRDYVADKLKKARTAMTLKMNSAALAATVTDESGIEIQSLNDILPPWASRSSGTYGTIARASNFVVENSSSSVYVGDPAGTNFWWAPKYLAMTAPFEVNYEADLTSLWNSVHNNQVPPDMILTTKRMIEIYDQFADDKTQIIKSEAGSTVDLGYTTYKFRGADFTWDPNVATDTTMLLTADTIEVKYEPNLWFDMTEWKPVPNSLDRFCQILARCNIKCNELRRQGRLYNSAVG